MADRELLPELTSNLKTFSTLFGAPMNNDFVTREFAIDGVNGALLYLEGMADGALLGKFVLCPCLSAVWPKDVAPEDLSAYLSEHVLNIAQIEEETAFDALSDAVVDGRSVLLLDGCSTALVLETRDYEKRQVDRPQSESVVVGAQQGFVENLRTNLTLLHRIVRTPKLMVEMTTIGQEIPTRVALTYLKGAVDETALSEIRRRIRSLNLDYVPDSGQLQALIEDSPNALIPQMLETERPDRTADCLTNGQIAIMVDNSPYALIAPITFFHLLHTADDGFLRWQYGSFVRILRIMGLLLSLYLPGIYMALTTFHTHMIPLDLLTSIAESRAKVPFPIFTEILILELSFFLINEAGTRIPSQLGSALGIVGGLILGQAAVAASITSPILIIIVSLAGLGNYAAPTYSLSVAIQILRLGILLLSAAFGLYGVVLISFVYACVLGNLRSMGQPMLAPFAPYRKHNPDLILRLPLFMQKRLLFFANRSGWLKRKNPSQPIRGWKGGGT